MSPRIIWQLGAVLINCEDTTFSTYLLFLLFLLSLNCKLYAPKTVPNLLTRFIFATSFSAYPPLYLCRKICCKVFHSAIICKCFVQSFCFYLFYFAIILFSVLFLISSHYFVRSRNMYVWTVKYNMYVWTVKTLSDING
jgi:hypothetical protein